MELVLTPAGHLLLEAVSTDAADTKAGGGEASRDERFDRVVKAFAQDRSRGLFSLAAENLRDAPTPAFHYWRNFAAKYLTELCRTPEAADARVEPILPPNDSELGFMVLGAPPMRGAEYLTISVLQAIWTDLDGWARGEIASRDDGLSGFLKHHAPLWHQVGRVCFHLAENRRDPDYPFAFLATYAPSIAGSGRVQYQPLGNALREYAGAKNKKALIKLLSPVEVASQESPLVKDLLESGDLYQPLAWTPAEAYRLLKEIPLLEKSGILVRLPDWWKKRSRPRVAVTVGEKRRSAIGTDGLLDFSVDLALGDERLTDSEWRELMAGGEGLVLLRGQWVEVDRDKLAQALEHWKSLEQTAADGLSFAEGMRLLAGAPMELGGDDLPEQESQWSFVHAGQWLREVLDSLRGPERLVRVAPGGGFKAVLREYQEVGVNWLWFLSRLGLGACLADDMGLGKTIQVLALLSALKDQPGAKPSLLVLPASLLANWKSEIQRFAPTLRAKFLHLSEISKDAVAAMADDPARALKNTDIVLTTYGMLLRHEWLREVDWQLVILDESQAIKNPTARQTKAVKQLRADARIALTGTPVENRLTDLWSLFDFLCPGLLGSQGKFKQFVKALEGREQNRYAPLRGLVQPYILRRLKTDKRVIADLPDKTEVRAFCGLSKRQAALYAKMVQELAESLKSADGMKRRGLVLAYLMRFKQLCNHPSHLLGDGQFGAAESGKFLRLAEIAEEIASRQEKTLVFTQFREMAEPLAEFLSKVFGRAGLILHGGTPVGKRKQLVDRFQAEDGPPFFVLSLKAGGTGLNLTAASHVVHFDRWWNPAVENQATDRAFRIGQKRNVLVHKFVCRGTVEEKIDALIEEKTQLATDLLEGGAEKLLTEMSDSELVQLVSLDVEKALI